MSDLLAGALSVLLATNPPAAVSNFIAQRTGLAVAVAGDRDPAEQEFQRLLAADDAAQEEAEKITAEAEHPGDLLLAPSKLTIRARLDDHYRPVRARYEDFLGHHPQHARAHVAYASFLNDTGDEDGAVTHYERSRELEPKAPAAWNNLANLYAHRGPVEKAFPYYDEAIRLNPNEPLYLHNFGTLVFLFRKDATNYFRCDEQAVFTRALALYDRALKLDPHNFPLASDVAQTFYGIKPPPTENPAAARAAELRLADQALASWTNALGCARDGLEREGVYLHFARWNLRAGRLAETHANLAGVTNAMYAQLKQRLERNLMGQEQARSDPDPPAAGRAVK